jgi:Rod binding domain-containing protein
MSDLPIPSGTVPLLLGDPKNLPGREAARGRAAAEQFEGLLIAQMLRTVRESSSGWLGGEDQAGECATGLAEEQLAQSLAKAGGLGLSALIAKGLSVKAER